METIYDIENLGYILENVQNRLFRVKNNYGDVIAIIYVNSGFIDVKTGYIFNYKLEIKEAIKKIGTTKFLNLNPE